MMKKQDEEKYEFKKKIIRFILIPAIGIIILFLLFFPPLIKTYLINSLKEMGLKNPQFTIRHVGFNQFDIQHFSVGDVEKSGKPGLTIPNLAVDFSWLDLLKGSMRKIEITGMSLNVIVDKEGFTVKGLEPLFKTKSNGKPTLPIDRINIASSVAQVNWEGRSLTIPFSLTANTDRPNKLTTFSIDLAPYEETIAAKGTINMDSGAGAITITADHADLEKYFNNFNITFVQWLKSGLKLNAAFNVTDWGIQDSYITLAIPAFSAGFPGGNTIEGSVNLDFKLNRQWHPEDVSLKLRIENINDKDFQVELPFNLDIHGSRLNALQLKLDQLRLKQPPGIHFQDFIGTVSLDTGQLQAQGSFECGIDAEFVPSLFPDLKMDGVLRFKGNAQVLANDKGTTWNLNGNGGGKVLFTSKKARAGIENLALSLASTGKDDDIKNRMDVNLKGVNLKYEDMTFSAGNIFFQNNIDSVDGKNWTGSGMIKITSAQMMQPNGTNARGIHIDVPWHYPFIVPNPNSGNWGIDSLKFGNLDLGKIIGLLKQKEIGIEFTGKDHAPVESLTMKVNGNCQWLRAENEIGALLQFEIPETQVLKDSQLERLHPALTGYQWSGYISGLGTVTFLQNNFNGHAQFKLRDVEMESNTGGIKCHGMNSTINFKDLLNFKTEIEQRIDFKSVEVSGMQLNEGHLLFEIISPDSIYSEGGEFAFCGGRILLQPLRFNLNDENLKITLYGDRINFAEMVNALQGEQIAFGDAELNGMLTVGISDGIPVFRDGYLYSTPGVGGNIKFTRSEAISGGVLLVEEAVKDFNYDWIKVKLDTANDKLNVTAFINGIPAGKLPLTYDMKTKDIVRDKGGERLLELKGLLLEIRFTNLDLKRLMKGGIKIYSQQKKIP